MKVSIIDIVEGITLANFDTYCNSYMRYADKNKPLFEDKLSLELGNILLNFGQEVIRPPMYYKQKILTNKTFKMFNDIHKYFKNKNMFIDSGGFQILKGYVPKEYMVHLIDMYIDFLRICKENNMENLYYFYLDINPIKEISPEYSISHMMKFQNLLEDMDKDNWIRDKMYIIHHCNTPLSYQTFTKFFNENNIIERIGSHRYAVGGMVPLNFNSVRLQIKTYLYPLFEVIEKEREYLESGGHVHYHVLGMSGLSDEFLLIWCMLYFKMIGWNLHISFDSTTALFKATQSNTLYHVKDNDITIINTKYENIKNKPDCKKPNVLTNGEYIEDIINFINENIHPKEKNKVDTLEKCFTKNTNDKINSSHAFRYMMIIYNFWSYSQIFNIFKNSAFEIPEIITDHTGTTRYNHMMDLVTKFKFIKNMKSYKIKTYKSLNNSLEYLMAFVEKKIKIDQIRNMCLEDTVENIKKLSFNDKIEI